MKMPEAKPTAAPDASVSDLTAGQAASQSGTLAADAGLLARWRQAYTGWNLRLAECQALKRGLAELRAAVTKLEERIAKGEALCAKEQAEVDALGAEVFGSAKPAEPLARQGKAETQLAKHREFLAGLEAERAKTQEEIQRREALLVEREAELDGLSAELAEIETQMKGKAGVTSGYFCPRCESLVVEASRHARECWRQG